MPVKFPHPQKVLVSFISYFVAKYYAEKSTYSKYFLTEGIDYHKFELKIDLYTTHIIRNTSKAKLKKMKTRQIQSIF